MVQYGIAIKLLVECPLVMVADCCGKDQFLVGIGRKSWKQGWNRCS